MKELLVLEGEYGVENLGDGYWDEHVMIDDIDIDDAIIEYLRSGHLKRVRITVEVLEE